jgi:hypothetical protein
LPFDEIGYVPVGSGYPSISSIPEIKPVTNLSGPDCPVFCLILLARFFYSASVTI